MNKPQIVPKICPTPEDIYNEAIVESGPILTKANIRLLQSGLAFLKSAQNKCLNEIELTAVSGMIAFVAYTQEADEATIEAVLSATFKVGSVKEIPSRRYDEAMDFLLNMKIVNIVN